MNLILLILLILFESLLVFCFSLFIFYKKFIKPFMKKFEANDWSSFWNLLDNIKLDSNDNVVFVNEENV